MIRRNGKPVPGFAIGGPAPGDERADRLGRCLNEALDLAKNFAGTLSPREKTILELGLVASHLEESSAHGDWKRAEAHAENLMKLVRQLGAR